MTRPPEHQRLRWRPNLTESGEPDRHCIVSSCWGYTVARLEGLDGPRYCAWRTNRTPDGRRPSNIWPELLLICGAGDEAKAACEWDAIRRGHGERVQERSAAG